MSSDGLKEFKPLADAFARRIVDESDEFGTVFAALSTEYGTAFEQIPPPLRSVFEQRVRREVEALRSTHCSVSG